MKPFAPWSADENWDEYLAPSFFVGRCAELKFLETHLLSNPPTAVGITAEPGMGKTALAMSFAHIYRSHFTAGGYKVRATPFQRLPDAVDGTVSHPNKPYLLVLDDLETRPHGSLASEVNEIRAVRPNASLLLLSRPTGALLPADVTLSLSGLSQVEFRNLIEISLSATAADSSVEQLFGVSGGNASVASLVAQLAQSGHMTLRDLLEHLRSFSRSTVLGPDGQPLQRNSPSERQIIVDLNSTTMEALSRFHRDPQLMHELAPRQFEELVAEILSRLGYDVTLTPASKDGGKDIYAAKKDHIGTFLYLVECKKYSPNNPVKVGLVRQLNGVVQAERATAGILVTTSFFTRGARELEKQLSHQISLKDYIAIQEWLARALHK